MKLLGLIFLLSLSILAHGETSLIPLQSVQINLKDKASLQRGAKWYINYCAGCHSMQYLRYNRMAGDIGIVDVDGNINANLLKTNLIFTGVKITDPIYTSMMSSDAKEWFGVAAPDLTLVARVRGADWLYTYLMSFYDDPNRPWGTNNLLFQNVAMPNVLLNLQGKQIPVYRVEVRTINGKQEKVRVIDHLILVKAGLMSPVQFSATVNDLVNFLTYAGEPTQLQRKHIGYWVLLFLSLFALVTYLLKREYWRDVK